MDVWVLGEGVYDVVRRVLMWVLSMQVLVLVELVLKITAWGVLGAYRV